MDRNQYVGILKMWVLGEKLYGVVWKLVHGRGELKSQLTLARFCYFHVMRVGGK